MELASLEFIEWYYIHVKTCYARPVVNIYLPDVIVFNE